MGPAAIELSLPKGLRRRPKRSKSDTYSAFLQEHPDTPKWALAAAAGLDQRLNAIEDRLDVVEQRLMIVLAALVILFKLPIQF